ncbi:MAG: SDR family NAD(P)-dependent oxidoreductase [Thermoleophilia bacterium]|nr:SDR family NAD(P)-dependent oxidoreductase [Thermoleophilia bacterium]
MELDGTSGLLTGAAGGIGKAVARRLAEEGVTLVLSDLDEVALESLRGTLPGDGHSIFTADLADREQSASIISRVEAEAGPLDLLVKAITGDKPLLISNNRPIRPITALSTITPGLSAKIMERSGANQIFRNVAAHRES